MTHLTGAASRLVPTRFSWVSELFVLPNLMHLDLLDKFSILIIRHDPLDHFLTTHTFVWRIFNFVH